MYCFDTAQHKRIRMNENHVYLTFYPFHNPINLFLSLSLSLHHKHKTYAPRLSAKIEKSPLKKKWGCVRFSISIASNAPIRTPFETPATPFPHLPVATPKRENGIFCFALFARQIN